ncbi:MAG: hypothetical protein JRN19_04395 [Nitrososphaerota archaeon]|nr:hypothetical protein [Nitrososphaerota archaeon]MDG7049276.1 hypothetical protein [Nitrososphaerota archaeon]MDG7051671.1 hypothetical protein [Nitrososphaerota archaeon]
MPKLDKIIGEALSDYGETTKNVIIWHMEHTYNLRLEEVQNDPARFVNALKDILGGLEDAVERNISQRVAREYGIKYGDQGLVKLLGELK